VPQCAKDLETMKLATKGCRQLINGSEKAKLQWQLESDLSAFEGSF
jgi:hypothetical protein